MSRSSRNTLDRRSLLGAIVLGMACILGTLPVRASSDETGEYTLKAVLMMKFIGYLDWPKDSFDDKKSPIVVGVLGKDPFGSVLEQAAKGKKRNNRSIVTKRFPTIDSIGTCHVLFVPSSEAANLTALKQKLRGQRVAIVGESKDFAALGGTINFYRDDKKLAFEINHGAAKREKLKISSDLLKLARIVKDKKPAGG